MTIGFVPSYELDTDTGKKIAKLKGLEYGWHYPTFLLYYIRNPGPLLLFDQIIVDEEAARKAIEYMSNVRQAQSSYESSFIHKMKPTESEIRTFQNLIDSRLFRKERVVDFISEEDFEKIQEGYIKDTGISNSMPVEFSDGIAIMKKRYGENYATPSPQLFEAMNINVTWVLLRKLSAVPLDDVLRSPLYEYKAAHSVSGEINMARTAYLMIKQARQVLYLPTKPLHDVDAFLSLHGDPRIVSFRHKVQELSEKRASRQQISREIYEANNELRKLDIDSFNLVIAFLGSITALASLYQGNFVTGLVGTATALLEIGKEILKPSRSEKYGWLELTKGMCEI